MIHPSLPLEISYHVLSFTPPYVQGCVLPLVCKSWRQYVTSLQEHPLDFLIQKILDLRYIKFATLEQVKNILSASRLITEFKNRNGEFHLKDQEYRYQYHSDVVLRTSKNQVMFPDTPEENDLMMPCKISMTLPNNGKEPSKFFSTYVTYESTGLLISNDWIYVRKGNKWKSKRDDFFLDTCLADIAMQTAFKIAIYRIAESNMNKLMNVKKLHRTRCICDKEGNILRISTQKERHPLPFYFDFKVRSKEKLLGWKCGSLNSVQKEAYSVPSWLPFQWAVIAKTTKLVAHSLGLETTLSCYQSTY